MLRYWQKIPATFCHCFPQLLFWSFPFPKCLPGPTSLIRPEHDRLETRAVRAASVGVNRPWARFWISTWLSQTWGDFGCGRSLWIPVSRSTPRARDNINRHSIPQNTHAATTCERINGQQPLTWISEAIHPILHVHVQLYTYSTVLDLFLLFRALRIKSSTCVLILHQGDLKMMECWIFKIRSL